MENDLEPPDCMYKKACKFYEEGCKLKSYCYNKSYFDGHLTDKLKELLKSDLEKIVEEWNKLGLEG